MPREDHVMDAPPATKPVSAEKKKKTPSLVTLPKTTIIRSKATMHINLLEANHLPSIGVEKQIAGLATKLNRVKIKEKKTQKSPVTNIVGKGKVLSGSPAKKGEAAKTMNNIMKATKLPMKTASPRTKNEATKPAEAAARLLNDIRSVKASNSPKKKEKKGSKKLAPFPSESVLPLLQTPPGDDWKLTLSSDQLTPHIEPQDMRPTDEAARLQLLLPRFTKNPPPVDSTATPRDLMRLSAALDLRKKTAAVLAELKTTEKEESPPDTSLPMNSFKKKKPTGPRPQGCIAPPMIDGPYPVLYQVILKQHADNGGLGGLILEAKDAALFLCDRMDLRLVGIDDAAENVMTSGRDGLSWVAIGDYVWIYGLELTSTARHHAKRKMTMDKASRLLNGCQRDTAVFWRATAYAQVEPAAEQITSLILGQQDQGWDGMVKVALPGSKDAALVPSAQCDVKRKPEGNFVAANVRKESSEDIWISAMPASIHAHVKIAKIMEHIWKASEESWRRSADAVRPLLSVEEKSSEFLAWVDDRHGDFQSFSQDEQLALERMDEISRAASAGCALANLRDEDKRWRSAVLQDIRISDNFINLRAKLTGFVTERGWAVKRQALLRFNGCARQKTFIVTASDLDTNARVLTVQLITSCAGWKENDLAPFKAKSLTAGIRLVPLPDTVDPIFTIIAQRELGKLPKDSTALHILRAIYSKTTAEAHDYELGEYLSVSPSEASIKGSLIKLREEQRLAIDASLSPNPIIMIQAAFGTGKTTTSALIAAEAVTKHKRFIAVTAVTNAAVAQFCNCLASLDGYGDLRLLRLVSPEASDVHPTPYDLAAVMGNLISTHGHKMNVEEMRVVQDNVGGREVMRSLADGVGMWPNLTDEQQEKYVEAKNIVEKTNGKAMEILLRLRPPRIILATVASMLNKKGIVKKFGSEEVKVTDFIKKMHHKLTILCDEASQVPEPALNAMLHEFPYARLRFIGDHRQLEPYTLAERDSLAARAGAKGISVVLAHAANVPKVALVETFRCHPAITELPSDLFYESRLVSLATPDQRQEISRLVTFPNPEVPVALVDVAGEEVKSPAKSYSNAAEAAFARQLVSRLLEGGVPAGQIFVISFYKEQQKVMSRQLSDIGVVSTTVDSVQGREATVAILLTTRTKPNLCGSFLDEPTRMNVALSRARSGLFVLGALPALKNQTNWGRLLKWTEERKAIINSEQAVKAFSLKA